MKQVKCKSGITGYQCRLRKSYDSFEEFEAYDEIYGVSKRLGFKSAEAAWKKNPLINGSIFPSDLCVVKETSRRGTQRSPFGIGS
jgi:hypothetical protein